MVADALPRQYHTISAISSAVPTLISDVENSYTEDPSYTNLIQQLNINETLCQCFLHRQDIGWSRSCIPVLRWSCEL
jgi:hypothetical protein